MNLTAIILSGGKSSRMGEDKGLMTLDGKSMIQHVIDAIEPLVNEIIIISNSKEYKRLGYPVYEDIIKEKGPLAGIYTGLCYSKNNTNIILSCDVPYINKQIISFLLDHSEGFDITIPEKNGKTHQLMGIFSGSCLTELKKLIDNDCLKLKTAFETLNLNVIDANQFDDKLFTNINTKSDIDN